MTKLFDTGHALVIGVGNYAKLPGGNMPQTAADAQMVAEVLRDPTICGYPEDQVTLLTGAAATRQGILDALDSLAKRVDTSGTVFLFYSGHGAYDPHGNYYLTTYDTDVDGQRVAPGSAVSQGEFLTRLRKIAAARLVIILNPCFSGDIAETLGADGIPFMGANPSEDELKSLLGSGEGRVVMTACRQTQCSYVGNGQLTVFTEELVNGLRGGNGVRGRGGLISVYDLYTSLFYAVDEAVSDDRRVSPKLRAKYGKQEPELTAIKNVGPFPIALYQGASATLGAFDPPSQPAEDTAFREVSKAEARALFSQYAQAQMQQSQVDTGGDARVNIQARGYNSGVGAIGNPMGTVNQSRGDIVHGDKVSGDKVSGDKISVGDISGSSGIAIGRSASAYVTTGGESGSKIGRAFQAIYMQIRGSQLGERRKDLVMQQAQQIEAEALRGDLADASFIQDLLASLQGIAPNVCGAVAQTLASAGSEVSADVRKAAASI
jgi:uncharacterized caspase-like protein